MSKFNSLYRDVQQDVNPNAQPQAISKVAEAKADPTWIETPTIVPETIVQADAGDDKEAGDVAPPPEGPGTVWIILGLLVALAATGGTMFFLMKGSKRPARRPSYGTSEPVFGGGSAGPAPTKSRKRPAASKKPGATPQKTAASPQKSAAPRKASEGQAPRKKRPAPTRSPEAGAAPKPQAKPKPKPRPKPPTGDAE